MSTPIRAEVPFKRLRVGTANVRRIGVNSEAYRNGLTPLAASIRSQGILQNLVVHLDPTDEMFEVDAGGRRYGALALLVEQGHITDEYPVPVLIIGADAATAASLTENVQRQAMHPADEFDAFLEMTSQGWTIDRIADSFGVTPLVVERRLKLQEAAPALLDDFRSSKISTDQLIALCSTNNHELQTSVWTRVRNSNWGNTPADLRRSVLQSEVEADKDPRIAFIGGLEVYENAGGKCRRDLFATDGKGVILEDAPLIEGLVTDKLAEIAEEFTVSGWGWVEVWRSFDHDVYYRYGRAPTIAVELSAEDSQRLDGLRSQLVEAQAASDAYEESDDDSSFEPDHEYGELLSRVDDLETEIEKLTTGSVDYATAVMEHSGVIIYLEHNGEVRIEKGLVRTSDRAKVAEVLGEGQQISGGRETEPAGRKTDAMSDALRRSLLGHRNLAAQFAAAMNPKSSKVLLVCQFVTSLRKSPSAAPTDLCVGNGYGARTYCTISDDAGQAKGKEFEALGEALVKDLPEDLSELWDTLFAMAGDELDVLLAYSVARSVSLKDKHDGLTGKFLDSMGFNMAEHFTATAGNYLTRVPKELIIEALSEAEKLGDENDRSVLLGMKKRDLGAEAETRLAGSGWVPAVIRTPLPAPVKAPSKKTPARKSAKA